ncbi:MAG: glycosyltransferase family 2 protein [Patescibacteria group bacterium]
MRIIVIIVTYNAQDRIATCLRSVYSQSYAKDKYDVMVVDNASSDATVDIVSKDFSDVLLLPQKRNLGFAKGNNLGIMYALERGYDAVVLLNDDTKPRDTWLEHLVVTADEDPYVGIVQSKILFMQQAFRVDTIGNPLHPLGFSWSGGYKHLSSDYTEDRDVPVASGASMLIKRSVLERIGLLDEYLFMYHEDVDYSWRARLAGFRVRLASQSVVFHDHTFTLGGKKFYYAERNRLLVLASRYRLWTICLLLPALLATEVAMIFYAFISGWGMWKIKSYGGFILSIFHIIKERSHTRQIRTMSDKEIMRVMTTSLKFDGIKSFALRFVYNPIFRIYFSIVKNFIV